MFTGLSRGIRRLWIGLTFIWIVAFFFIEHDDISLGWTAALSTPSTQCVDVYDKDGDRRADCEFAGPGGWAEDMLRKDRGESVPFDYYQAEKADAVASAWLWWLGLPIVGLILLRLSFWILDGFRLGRRNS